MSSMVQFARMSVASAALCLLSLIAATGRAQQTSFALTVNAGGSAAGTVAVIGSGGGLCTTSSAPCTFQIPSGTAITIAANAPSGQTPGRLSGGTGPAASCALSTCTFTTTSAASVTATFTVGDGPVATLTTTMSGDGAGAVAADNSRCQNFDALQPSACATAYLQGSSVTLSASAAAASRFSGYASGTGGAGACGAGAQCSFTLDANAAVTATFHKLVSIRVTPTDATRVIGQTATFTALGAYSNGLTEAIVPGPGTWVTDASHLNVPRYSLAAAGIFSSSTSALYALGGVAGGVPSAVVEVNTGSGWVTKAPMSAPREGLAAADWNQRVYAIGGNTTGDTPLQTVERYLQQSDSWEPVASLARPRRYLAAVKVTNPTTFADSIFAVGGETLVAGTPTVVGDVEEFYSGLLGTGWTARASMPTPRRFLGLGTVHGILYAIGGQVAGGSRVATVEAYDPSTDTWTTKTPMPAPRSGIAVFSNFAALYVLGGTASDGSVQATTYRYDPANDTWTTEADMPTARTDLAAGLALPAIGGRSASGAALDTVERFSDTLTWFSSGNAATVSQSGMAAGVAYGSSTITAAAGNVGCTTFPVNTCGRLTVTTLPTDMSVDVPANNATVSQPFEVDGWAINRSAATGTGIDRVRVIAVPAGEINGISLGMAQYGIARSDIGGLYGSQFTNSGFSLIVNTLPPGSYSINVYPRNAAFPGDFGFDTVRTVNVNIVPGVSNPAIAVDAPTAGQTVTSAFEVGGWALDQGASTGTGVDSVRFYIQPQGQPAPGVFVGTGTYGIARPDLGAIYGSRFTNVGYHFTLTGLSPGSFTLNVYARSTVTKTYSIVKSVPITVSATALMSIDVPSPEATITASSFVVGGWSIDRSVEGTAQAGTGVDALHVYAYPNPGSGQPPIFLGVADMGVSRPDVGAAYGSRYDTSGYQFVVDRDALGLAPGLYGIVVHSHSAVSGTFNNDAVVWVRLQ